MVNYLKLHLDFLLLEQKNSQGYTRRSNYLQLKVGETGDIF